MKKKIKWVVLAVLIIGVLGAMLGGDDSSDSNKETKEKTEQKEEKKQTYTVGDTAEVDDIKITVKSTRIDEGISPAEEGKQYFVMDIQIENTSKEKFSSSSLMCYELKDSEGRKMDMSIMVDLNGSLDTEIEAGEQTVGEIAYEVPSDGELTLKFTPFLDDSVKIKVR